MVLEVIGWVGSALVVLSLMQGRVMRFRWMNLAGSVVATFYNAVIEIWPFVAMNGAIAIINVYWLWRLYREAEDPAVYKALEVEADDPFLRHLLAEHAADIAASAPNFDDASLSGPNRATLLLVRGDEAVGVVLLRRERGGVGIVELDWVKPRFRDFTPGRFVFSESGALRDLGFTRAEVEHGDGLDAEYLRKAGFVRDGDRWVHGLDAVAKG